MFSHVSVCPQGGLRLERGRLPLKGGWSVFGRGSAWRGGLHGEGDPPSPRYGQPTAGTHPIGTHSSFTT